MPLLSRSTVAAGLFIVGALLASCGQGESVATPTVTPLPTEVATSPREPVPTMTPTATASPTPTQIPGRPELYEWAQTPEHMASIWWEWEEGGIRAFEELVLDFTIQNDVELGGGNGLYLMLAFGQVSGIDFYLGLQTNVKAPQFPLGRGKGLIFSRWGTRELANARVAETDGWAQSSGHEGDFIGIRRPYDWSAGDYRVRLAPDESSGPEPDGVWLGLWITDLASNVTTWIGSLKFPLLDGKPAIGPSLYSTIEIYGRRIRPIDIPRWHVSIAPPVLDGVRSSGGITSYAQFWGALSNADIRYDAPAGVVDIKAGGTTERRTRAGVVRFE